MEQNKLIDRLLFTVFEGHASEKELYVLKKWIEDSNEHRIYFEHFRKCWLISTADIQHSKEYEKSYFCFLRLVKQHNKKIRLRHIYHYAAILVLLISCTLYYLETTNHFLLHSNTISMNTGTKYQESLIQLRTPKGLLLTLPDTIKEISSIWGSKMESLETSNITDHEEEVHDIIDKEEIYDELIVPKGKSMNLQLTDGTSVSINSGSYLRFPRQFTTNERNVYLKGEAFFNVTKDTEHPFFVHVDSIAIRVYGTQFNVNSNINKSNIEIILAEGSIGIGSNGNYTMMIPGEKAICNKNNEIEIVTINLSTYRFWKDGYITFEDINIEDALSILSRLFDYSVLYKNDNVKKLHLSACLKRERGIEDILRNIEKIINIKFQINQRMIIVE